MTQIPAPGGDTPAPQSSSTSQPTAQPATATTRTARRRSASPEGSYYAMSDDEEGGYNTVTHTETGRGVKLLYSKSKVYIHPTPSAKDNISGFIALLQQKPARRDSHADRPTSSSSLNSASLDPSSSDLLLAWLPESSLGDAASVYVKVDLNDEGDSPPRQTYLVPPPPTITTHQGSVGHYAFAIPVSAIYSLLVRPPSLGWWFGSVIINTRAGDSFPALFFHDSECMSTMLQKKKRARETFDPFGADGGMFWGGDEVLRWLRRYIHIERSGAEPNIYLVEPTKEDSDAFSGKLTTSSVSAIGKRDSMTAGDRRTSGQAPGAAGPSSRRQPTGGGGSRDAGMDPFMKFVKETGWNIMEKFSKVTTFTRNAAQNVLDDPRVPPQMRRLLRNPEVQTIQEEFDSARIYLARWAMGMAEQSDRDRNQRIWTAHDIMELEDTDVGEFELVDSATGLSLEERRKPVTLKEWNAFFDARTGRLSVTTDEVKERIFHGGLHAEDGVRKEAWLFLLGVHEWYSTADERKARTASLRDQYIKLKGQWWDRLVDLGGQGEEGEWWREQRGRIEKDVHRTDRNVVIFAGENIPHPDPDSPFAEVGTNVHMEQLKDLLLTYNEYNRELGYVQGMSDLLAPIYAVVQDDALAFWAFQHFMERMERNFLRDQSGMRAQLLALDHLLQFMDPKLYDHLRKADSTNFFFFFRMLLVWYKREFDWLDVLRLWEGLWTDYLSSSFHLFIALAILEKHRDVIMMHLEQFDEVLKYVNELSGTIDLESTLIRAEALFRRFQRLVEAVDKQNNFPAPRLKTDHSSASAASAASTASSNATIKPASSSSSGGAEMNSMPGMPGNNQPASSSSPSAAAAGKAPEARNSTAPKPAAAPAKAAQRIITPELRGLLSRNIYVVPKNQPGSDKILWGNMKK
ncbi:GTPase-activating protein GYP7 [Sporothrix schenckii 1099-18]|uniref:GTPase-activating protein GYP7 n=1 Tax=Sporothrix schenckii 1099-18 TaxID=1397361 RepID=A0A0F2MK14_SPOSC|nr:GTPase-activating protein GYP7 [Sporothrix schenckii 1099-18]KJR89942.1 GTPase-activating protein GYP7 [Sporothrix schenckii 1099-18]